MKKILLSLLSFFVIGLSLQAQNKAVETARIKTPDALCEKCKARIEKSLANYVGITQATVNFKRGETVVKFYKERLNVETIRTVIANTGYAADEFTPTDDMYNLLPASCKKQVDGGHPNVKPTKPAPTN